MATAAAVDAVMEPMPGRRDGAGAGASAAAGEARWTCECVLCVPDCTPL
jgi:hypothetical protein